MYQKDKIFKELIELLRARPGLSRRDATKQLAIKHRVEHSTIRAQTVSGQGFSCTGELDDYLRSLGLDP